MKRGLQVVILPLLLVVFSTSASHARRTPAMGGRVSLSVDGRHAVAVREAHLNLPLLERMPVVDERERLAFPPLAASPAWRSLVMSDLRSTLGGRVWRVVPRLPGVVVEAGLRRCLVFPKNPKQAPWPSRVLRAVGVSVEVERNADDILVRFSQPVGPLPALLAGCDLPRSPTASGPYAPSVGEPLLGRQGALRGPPALGMVEFRPLGRDADVQQMGDVDDEDVQVLATAHPDVVLLVRSNAEVQKNRLQLDTAERQAAFRQALGMEQLVDIYAQGRGAPTLQLLPPGLVPARKLRQLPSTTTPMPLTLVPLGPSAPVVPVAVLAEDPLLNGTLDRLNVLARSSGLVLRKHRVVVHQQGWALVRWQPRSSDPALALLELLTQHAPLELPQSGDKKRSPQESWGERLLAVDDNVRLQAALDLERLWLQSGQVLPLLTAERWYTVRNGLQQLRLRDDGTLLLMDAYWEAQP